MTEQGPAGQAEEEEENIRSGEARIRGLGRMQEWHPNTQSWNQESQGTDRTKLGEGYEKQHEKILQLHWAEWIKENESPPINEKVELQGR